MLYVDYIIVFCFNNVENYEKFILVIVSRDGYFKVWILIDDFDIYKKSCWLDLRFCG